MAPALKMVGTGGFPRGIHPPEHKEYSRKAKIEVLPVPKAVSIPLLQHTGAPNQLLIKPRTLVKMGDCIARAEAMVSAPVHASISGKAGSPAACTLPNGRHVQAIEIVAEGEQLEGPALLDALLGGAWPADGAPQRGAEEILGLIREAGIVGLGGAAFPTHVKLSVRPDKPIDTVLINGCECEPFLTADDRMMVEYPGPILAGAAIVKQVTGAARVVIAVEENKPEAATALQGAVQGTGFQVLRMATKYPMGGEKSLLRAALGRVVPTGGLPLDVGTVVVNVGTSAAIALAVLRGRPLTHRIVTVTGPGVAVPKNLLVPIGVSIRALLDHCGGLTPAATLVLAGGPMMGLTIPSLDTPITKGASGVTVLTAREVGERQETSCVRCGRCVDVCPLNLVPTRLALASRNRDWEAAKRHHLMACMECGCCAFACPARIPLVQLIRVGKASLPKG